jgi:transcriptional regulator with XRE-family HTH domain
MSDCCRYSDESFADQFRAARELIDLTQTEVLRRMVEQGFDWNRNTLSAIERKQRKATVSEALALADLVGVPVDALASAERHDSASRQQQVRNARDRATQALADLKAVLKGEA